MSIKNKILALISMVGCFIVGADPGFNYPVIDYKTCFGLSGGKYSCLAILESRPDSTGKVIKVLEYPETISNFPAHLPSYIGKGSIKLCMTKPEGEIFLLSFPQSGTWPVATFIDTDLHQSSFGMVYAHLLTMHDGKAGLFIGAGSQNSTDFQKAFKGTSLANLLNGAEFLVKTSDDLTLLVPPQIECDMISKWGARTDVIQERAELALIAHLGYGVGPSITDRLKDRSSDGLCTTNFGDYRIHFSVSSDTEAPPSVMIYNKAGQKVFLVSPRLALQSTVGTAQNANESKKADYNFYRESLIENLPSGINPFSEKEIEHLINKLPKSILDLEAELKR